MGAPNDLWDIDLEILEFVRNNPHCERIDIVRGVSESQSTTVARTTIKRLIKSGHLSRLEDLGAYFYNLRAGASG